MADRLTMMPLFQAMLDFDSTPETYERYDRMSALELFKQYGVSKRRAPARAPRFARSFHGHCRVCILHLPIFTCLRLQYRAQRSCVHHSRCVSHHGPVLAAQQPPCIPS